jgi:CheY-like chemotaxis protein
VRVDGEQLSGLTVLVVEDEPLIALMVEDMLRDFGAQEVVLVHDLETALDIADRLKVDLALVDVLLGNQNSYPIAHKLAARDVPFAFTTGVPPDGIEEGYRDRPILTKPYRQDELQAIFDVLLTEQKS